MSVNRRVAGALLVMALLLVGARGADESLISPENRVAADAPAWRELVALFAQRGDVLADFEERRFFPFRKEPLLLRGEARVSRDRGLSLHYTAPDERIVIVDAAGLLVRTASGASVPPDPRGAAGVAALLHVLRFDFAALEMDFGIFGRRAGPAWWLALVPKAETLRRGMGDIYVSGDAAAVRMIELRRSAKQHIDILLSEPRPPAPFSPEDVKRFFR